VLYLEKSKVMMSSSDNQLEKEYPKLGDDDYNNDEEYK
jgi:hypothetical protein